MAAAVDQCMKGCLQRRAVDPPALHDPETLDRHESLCAIACRAHGRRWVVALGLSTEDARWNEAAKGSTHERSSISRCTQLLSWNRQYEFNERSVDEGIRERHSGGRQWDVHQAAERVTEHPGREISLRQWHFGSRWFEGAAIHPRSLQPRHEEAGAFALRGRQFWRINGQAFAEANGDELSGELPKWPTACPAPAPESRKGAPHVSLFDIVEYRDDILGIAAHHEVSDAPREDQPAALLANALNRGEPHSSRDVWSNPVKVSV